MNKTYYTIFDLFKHFYHDLFINVEEGDPYIAIPPALPSPLTMILDWQHFLSLGRENLIPSTFIVFNNQYCQLLFQEYIFPKYCNRYIWAKETSELEKEFKPYKDFTSIFAWLNSSFEKYKPLLDAFTSVKANLMDDLETLSDTRFNDTPQDAADWYDAEEYNSTISQGKTKTQIQSNILKIKEINENIVSFYEQWADEFGKKFIYWSA